MSESFIPAVGWICALQEEFDASCRMLDEEVEDFDPEIDQNDNNTYVFGSISGHQVVIGCLPGGQYGTASAAIVAKDMIRSFQSLKFALMVGIGGGAPTTQRDIRLGDVVVSEPRGRLGGVIQYDFGKRLAGGGFQQTGHLNSPPDVLLGALPEMRRKQNDSRKLDRIAEHLKLMDEPDFRRPTDDRLYRSDYEHRDGRTCNNCESQGLQTRSTRTAKREITAHYGTIASANSVLKDAAIRDRYANDDDVLCFEMEAGGLMNTFPCLVIRGICDYCDSHKNDEWHNFAALAAAAYARELLHILKPGKVTKMEPWAGRLDTLQRSVELLQQATETVKSGVQSMIDDGQAAQVRQWLSPADPSQNAKHARELRHKGTGQWLLDSEMFVQWKNDRRQHLWLHGISGCGKTVLSGLILDHFAEHKRAMIYYFFDFRDKSKQKLEDLLRSLVFQLYVSYPESRKDILDLRASHEDGNQSPDNATLSLCIEEVSQVVGRVNVLIDALDECSERDRLLEWMERALSCPAIHFIATGRPEHEFEEGLASTIGRANYMSIDSGLVNNDIGVYVQSTLRKDKRFTRWKNSLDVREKIQNAIAAKADGMFRLAASQLDILATCHDLQSVEHELQCLPASLNATYDRMVAAIPERIKARAARLLQFLVTMERPLTLDEAVDVVAVRLDERSFRKIDRLPFPEEITTFCPGFLNISTTYLRNSHKSGFVLVPILQLAHFSVKEYLLGQGASGLIGANPAASTTVLCLTYLESISADVFSVDLVDFQGEFPLVNYAARNWKNLARPSEHLDCVLEATLSFLQKYEGRQLLEQFNQYETGRTAISEFCPMTRNVLGTPLYYACECGLPKVAARLLSLGADVLGMGEKNETPLEVASEMCHREIVEILLAAGANKELHDGSRDSLALHLASRGGCVGIVQQLLEAGADANKILCYHGKVVTALSLATEVNHVGVMKLLIQAGADINAAATFDSDTALEAASIEGHEEAVKVLLEAGADVNIGTGLGLVGASFTGRTRIVKLLLDAGADVSTPSTERWGAALSTASIRGQYEIVRMLLDAGTKQNAYSDPHMLGTALNVAISNRHESIVELLLDAGADVDSGLYDLQNEPALHKAVSDNWESMVEVLLSAGADVNLPWEAPNRTTYALTTAASRGNEAITKLLLDAGANVNACSEERMPRMTMRHGFTTALDVAVHGSHESVVKLLLTKGADVNQGQKTSILGLESLPVLSDALDRGHVSIMRLLLHAGAKLGYLEVLSALNRGDETLARVLWDEVTPSDREDDPWRVAFGLACLRGKYDALTLLLKLGMDVNQRDAEGVTALMRASQCGNVGIVNLLIDAGADVDALCSSQTTALKWASFNGRAVIVRALLNAGADFHHAESTQLDMEGTVLHIATRERNKRLVQEIVFAKISLRCDAHRWPHELEEQYEETRRVLVEAGVDVHGGVDLLDHDALEDAAEAQLQQGVPKVPTYRSSLDWSRYNDDYCSACKDLWLEDKD